MRVLFSLLLSFTFFNMSYAQIDGKGVKNELKKGNTLYQEKKYKEAQEQYKKALEKSPSSLIGKYNLGNALYHDGQLDMARMNMSESAKLANDKVQKASSYHNIGNTFLKEQKWQEAINSYKQALRENPNDLDTKYNLAYANEMLRKQQQQGGGGNNDDQQDDKSQNDGNKEDQDQQEGDTKDNQQDQKENNHEEDRQEEQQPKSQPSKLTEKQAENLLNALRQEEKKIQDKKEQEKGTPLRLEKDW